MKKRIQKPPFIAEWILSRFTGTVEKRTILGDMEEYFFELVRERGNLQAKMWYWIQIIKSIHLFITNKFYWSAAMFRNYIKVAFRNLKRHKGYSFINISGLAIGIACTMLLALWIYNELSYDRYHENAERIYRIVRKIQNPGTVSHEAAVPAALAPAIKEELPEIEAVTRIFEVDRWLIKYENKLFNEDRLAMVDKSFFKMFSFPFLQGDAANALMNTNSIILSEGMSTKYFGGDNPVGKILNVNNRYDLIVTGIVKIPKNTHLQYDFFIPFKLFEELGFPVDSWNWAAYRTYALLGETSRLADVNNKIEGMIKKHVPESNELLYLQPLSKIHLFSVDFLWENKNAGNSDIQYIYIFSLLAFVILLIACINFMNLSTARSSQRAKEIGLRKVIGSKKVNIIIQFLTEAFLLTLIASLAALFIVSLLLPVFNSLSGKEIRITDIGILKIFLGLTAVTMLTGIIAGSYPAFFLSALQPVKVFKDTLKFGMGRRSPLLGKVLVVSQFVLSVILIVFTFVISKQLNYMQNKNLGYNKEQIIYIRAQRNINRFYEPFKNDLIQNTNVINVTRTLQIPTSISRVGATEVNWEGKSSGEKTIMIPVFVDWSFIETFNMELIEGRSFSRQTEASDESNFIINETAAKLMELGDESPIGKWISYADVVVSNNGEANITKRGLIIGVVKDFHHNSLHSPIEPLLLRIGGGDMICIRIASNYDQIPGILTVIEETWKKHVPNSPIEYNFLDETIDNLYKNDRRFGEIVNYFAYLAVFISCLGLFGLAAYIAERRTGEIGIRKVLGASISNIVKIISKEFILLVTFSNLIAWPFAYFIVNTWLNTFAFRIAPGFELFVFSGVLVLIIALVTVSFQAVKAARANPVESLKYE